MLTAKFLAKYRCKCGGSIHVYLEMKNEEKLLAFRHKGEYLARLGLDYYMKTPDHEANPQVYAQWATLRARQRMGHDKGFEDCAWELGWD